MNRTLISLSAGLLAAAMATTWPLPALGQGGVPNCADLPNPVFMGGTTAVIPVIRLLGARLKQIGVTLLWNENSEGCSSVEGLLSGGTTGRPVFSQYDESTLQPGKVIVTTCNGALGQQPDLVINDVSYASCSYGGSVAGTSKPLPPGFREFQGPVQGLVPIVASSYTFYNDITAEELQDLYICGSKGNILTFTSDATIYGYNVYSSGMHELWARGLGLANGRAIPGLTGLGATSGITAETMVTGYVGPTIEPLRTIGYTSTEFYDERRDLVRALKVRGVGQNLAFWPDSDMTATDKINLREGRYTLQGTLWLVGAVDASGIPSSAGARNLVDWFQGNPVSDPSLQLPFDINDIYAKKGVVPQCAMRVTKTTDAPVFKRYRHPSPCHCHFEMLATGKTSIAGCTPCTSSSTCQTNQVCSYGYCERVD